MIVVYNELEITHRPDRDGDGVVLFLRARPGTMDCERQH